MKNNAQVDIATAVTYICERCGLDVKEFSELLSLLHCVTPEQCDKIATTYTAFVAVKNMVSEKNFENA